MNIVLLGGPASGKGTQAKNISQKYNLLHISTGQLLRDIINQNNQLSKTVKGYVQAGKLVPDDIIIDLLKDFLQKNDTKNGILFDGFPRTLNQAKELQKVVKIDYCIEIDVSLKTVLQRVDQRWVCSACGKNHIVSGNASELCNICGNKLVKRTDDTEQTATNRYNDYLQLKNNIIDFYKKLNTFYRIDGELSIQETFDQICKIIKV